MVRCDFCVGGLVTDHDIQAAIDRYDYFLTDLYHERLNPRGPCYTETVVSDVLAWDLSNNITPIN